MLRFFLVVLAALQLLVAQSVGGNGKSYYFRTMDIDATTLRVTLGDGIAGTSIPSGEFFAPFYRQTWANIRHFNDTQLYCDFQINESGVLTVRSKRQELIRGDFGTVYAETNYSYASEARIGLSVRGYANSAPHETPEITATLPVGKLSLDAISVIRIFQVGPGFIIASGQYSTDGLLQDIVVDAAKGGDWLHQNRIDEVDKSLGASVARADDFLRFQNIFGFPPRLRISDLLLDTDLWAVGGRKAFVTFVNLHYDRNRWVRQASFRSSGDREIRFLTYRVTTQDRALENLERRGRFRPAVVRQ